MSKMRIGYITVKDNSGIILVGEPFLLDDELKEKCIRWCEWANKVDEKEYRFFPELYERSDAE